MRKIFYYISPFIIIPVVLLSCEYIDNVTTIPMFPWFIIIPIFISCIMGILSSTHNKFDYIMTVLMPLSLFCFMFIGGFFDKSDLETMFHLDRAFEVALQPICLIEYFCITIATFLSSHKKLRMRLQKASKNI